MPRERNKIGPESPRTASRGPSSLRLPEVDPALRPPLYPGRDANVVHDCPPDLLPQVRDDPLYLVQTLAP